MKAANKKISKFRLKLNNFPYKLGNFHFLNENAELLSVVPKKKTYWYVSRNTLLDDCNRYHAICKLDEIIWLCEYIWLSNIFSPFPNFSSYTLLQFCCTSKPYLAELLCRFFLFFLIISTCRSTAHPKCFDEVFRDGSGQTVTSRGGKLDLLLNIITSPL
jgi:hypothetical protein